MMIKIKKEKKQYWLMKTEPDVFSFEDLKKRTKQIEAWDGVRNYQARNYMRDEMHCGDQVLFYHSNCEIPGVVGIAEIVQEAHPDPSAFDPLSPYYDPKSTLEQPRWFMVVVKWKIDFKKNVSLKELKSHPLLKEMKVVQKGQRLSVQPVTPSEFDLVCLLGLGKKLV